MSVADALSTAVSGPHASAVQFRTYAKLCSQRSPHHLLGRRIGSDQTNTGGVTTTIIEGGDVNLVSEYIDITQAKISYTANVKVVATTEELVGSLLDITG